MSKVCAKTGSRAVLALALAFSSPTWLSRGLEKRWWCGGKDGPGWEEDESVITMIGDCDAQSVRFYEADDQMPGHLDRRRFI